MNVTAITFANIRLIKSAEKIVYCCSDTCPKTIVNNVCVAERNFGNVPIHYLEVKPDLQEPLRSHITYNANNCLAFLVKLA